MAVANFIPEIWSKKLLKLFDAHAVMANLVNRDYEGEIKDAGDTVKVRTFGDITINDYTRDMTIVYEALTDPMQELDIDQQKYFAFKVDDLDKAQADVKILEGYVGRAAVGIRNKIDSRLLSHHADVHADNIVAAVGTPASVSKTNVYELITDMGEAMDAANQPADGRNLVIPPWFKTKLLNSSEFVRATSLGDKVVENGYIGQVGGFAVHCSTNFADVISGAKYPIMGFNKDFISYASQVSKVEHVRPSNMFADAVKGLYLYGSKVFQPKSCALLWAEEA